MTIAVTALKARIVAILKADASFDGVPLFIQGVPYDVPSQYYPFCMVAVTSEVTESRLTGNKHWRVYSGIIQFETLVQDNWTVVDRVAVVPSAVTVDTLVNACVALFKQAAHQTLDNLTFDGGAVSQFTIGEGTVEYGIAALERADSLHNFGTLPWQCRTLETFA